MDNHNGLKIDIDKLSYQGFRSSSSSSSNFIRLPDVLLKVRNAIEGVPLDFMVFCDLGMDQTTMALANFRLAPFQVAWWGHPITSGLPSIDFFFGLEAEILEAGHRHYSEQLIRMDRMNTAPIRSSHFTMHYDLTRTPLSQLLGLEEKAGEKDSNSIESVKLVLVLGRLFKLHPDFDAALATLLLTQSALPFKAFNRHKKSVDIEDDNIYIVLFSERMHEWNEIVFKRLRDRLNKMIFVLLGQGNDEDFADLSFVPSSSSTLTNFYSTEGANIIEEELDRLMSRIRIVGYTKYHRLLGHPATRVVLDTFPYGGCLTAHDALSLGRTITY